MGAQRVAAGWKSHRHRRCASNLMCYYSAMEKNDTKMDRVQSQYRFPRHLHEWLRKEAAVQNRSLNAQLVHIVQSAKDGAVK